MKILQFIPVCILLFACNAKEEIPAPPRDEFPLTINPLPSGLAGKWIRTTSLRTFDYKPDEWVEEPADTTAKKYLQLNANKTWSSNHLACNDCKIEFTGDTLYVKHGTGFYKFPVLAFNDTSLHLKTNIGLPAYSLPNTGLFDFVLEEKYRKAY